MRCSSLLPGLRPLLESIIQNSKFRIQDQESRIQTGDRACALALVIAASMCRSISKQPARDAFWPLVSPTQPVRASLMWRIFEQCACCMGCFTLRRIVETWRIPLVKRNLRHSAYRLPFRECVLWLVKEHAVL